MSINGYGWLPRNPYWWSGGASSGGPLTGFQYGWPSGPAGADVTGDVKGQYLFDEAAGTTLTDEVAAVIVTESGASGSPTYGTTTSGDYKNLSPGVTVTGAATLGKGWSKGADAQFDWGTSDVTIEWVALHTGADSGSYICDMEDAGGKGYRIAMDTLGADFFVLHFKTEDASNASWSQAITDPVGGIADGVIRKFRMVYDRDGNGEPFINGVSQGTTSLAAFNGKTVKANEVNIGQARNTALSLYGTIFEWRISLNATNNSGGDGGG